MHAVSCVQSLQQLQDPRKGKEPDCSLLDQLGVTAVKVFREDRPLFISYFHFYFGRRKDIRQDHRIRVAVGYDRPNIPGKAEGLFKGLIEGDEAVVRTDQCTVEIKQNELEHGPPCAVYRGKLLAYFTHCGKRWIS